MFKFYKNIIFIIDIFNYNTYVIYYMYIYAICTFVQTLSFHKNELHILQRFIQFPDTCLWNAEIH